MLRFRYFCLAFAALLSADLATVQAQTNPYTWQVGTSTWNTASNWLNGASVAQVPPSNLATQLVFNASGTTSYTTTNDIGAGTFTLNRITVNNTGTGTVTINGAAAANTFTFAGTAPTLDITGTVLFNGLFAGSATITKTGSGTFIHDSNNAGFTGQLVIDQGTFINRATTVAVTNFNPTLITVNNGGIYQFGAATVGDPSLPNTTYITVNTGGIVNWQEGEQMGGVNLQGGQINLQQGSITTAGATAQAWTSGTLTGGTFAIGIVAATQINKTTAGIVTISGGASVTGTAGAINIQNGTILFATAANIGNTPITLGVTTATGTQGTLQYDGGSVTRAANHTTNIAGGFVNVSTASTIFTLNGTLAGSGILTKTGPGTLALIGTLSQTGTVVASQGAVQIDPLTSAGGFGVSTGAAFVVNSGASTATATVPTLALANGSNVRFDLNTPLVPTVPLLNVSTADGITNGGTVTLQLGNQQGLANGLYTLIDYNGEAITSGYSLSLPGRTAGTLGYDTTNTTITATITGTDTIKWTGAINSVWDVGTAAGVGGTNNWQLVLGGNPTNFIQTDSPRFDDSATGTTTVQLDVAVAPNGVRFENINLTYTLQGTGAITGSTFLSKTGTGLVRIDTDNTYTGGTTISGGTLQLGNGGITGSIAGPITLGGGTLQFNRTDAPTFVNAITGTGTIANIGSDVALTTAIQIGNSSLTFGGIGNLNVSVVTGAGILNKTGTGNLTLYGNSNGFTGTVNIDGGRIILTDTVGSPFGVGGDLSASIVNVNNGGSFQFGILAGENPDFPGTTTININTGGIVEWRIGETLGATNLLGGILTLNGGVPNSGAVVNSYTSGTLNGPIAGAVGGPVAKTTAGIVAVSGLATFGGALDIQEGTIALTAAANLGTADISFGTITPTTGILEYQGASATRAGVFTFAGPGQIRVTNAAAELTLTANAAGTGTLNKTGAGILSFNGVNANSGLITVSAGTLAGTGTIAAPISVASGARIAGGTVAASTGTLTAANVTVASGGFLHSNLAASGTNNILALGTNTLDLATGSRLSLLGLPGFDPLGAGTYTLATTTGGNLKLDAGVSPVADGFIYGKLIVGTTQTDPVFIDTTNFGSSFVNGDQFVLSRSGDNLVLNYISVAVPEPSLLLGLGALGLGGVRWFRRRKVG